MHTYGAVYRYMYRQTDMREKLPVRLVLKHCNLYNISVQMLAKVDMDLYFRLS